MSKLVYTANSPYFATPQTSWYIKSLVFRPIPADSGDLPYTLLLRHEYRPDRLSYELYNTPAYWWVFCTRNAFLRRDPVWDFVHGLTIIVPTAAYLHEILGS
jgi:hypothetical protein